MNDTDIVGQADTIEDIGNWTIYIVNGREAFVAVHYLDIPLTTYSVTGKNESEIVDHFKRVKIPALEEMYGWEIEQIKENSR